MRLGKPVIMVQSQERGTTSKVPHHQETINAELWLHTQLLYQYVCQVRCSQNVPPFPQLFLAQKQNSSLQESLLSHQGWLSIASILTELEQRVFNPGTVTVKQGRKREWIIDATVISSFKNSYSMYGLLAPEDFVLYSIDACRQIKGNRTYNQGLEDLIVHQFLIVYIIPFCL